MSKITPALIPHAHFHKGSWLLSVKRPEWYYFRYGETVHEVSNHHFMESVDPPLKELVDLLHDSGIETTPSCSGHHKSKEEFEKVYDALEKDMKEIRSEGLYLKDIESGKIFLYRNKRYVIPWDRKTFLKKITGYQEKGVIGMYPGKEMKEQLLNLHIPGVRVGELDSAVIIQTDGHSDSAIISKWRVITKEIKNILNKKL